MKNIYLNSTVKKFTYFILFVAFFGVTNKANAQVKKAFTQRTSQYTPTKKIYNVKGDFTMLGNTCLTPQNYSATTNNNGQFMTYVDVDGDPNTFNSSSSTLVLSTENGAVPACSNIVYAGLYWTGKSSPNPTFDVTRSMPTSSQTINNNLNIVHNQNIANTNYTMSVVRDGNGPNNYYPRYTFSGNGNTYAFRFYNSSATNRVTLSINNGTETNIPATINGSGTLATLTTSYVITDGTVTISVKSLNRNNSTNSNSSTYQTTSTADVTVAGTVPLYTNVTKTFNKRIVKIKGPTASSYTQITAAATDIYYPSGTEDDIYTAYAEITDYVRNNGVLGQYTVADLALLEGDPGGTGYSGGWGIIVVYENSKMKWRDVTIFDGYAYVISNNSSGFELPVSGFNTVQSGNVGVRLGVMASEGDVSFTGDYFKIQNQNTTNYTDLSHNLNSTTNFFNSSINAGGTRNPSLVNNTGIDIATFNVPNAGNTVIGNSQTSTKFKYGTNGDTYSIFTIAMAVDAYIPEVEGVLSVSTINNAPAVQPYTVLPNQEVGYSVNIKNLGTEAVNNYKLIVPIPFNTTYVPGSAVGTVFFTPLPTPNSVTFDPNLGATGSIVWNMGTLPLPIDPSTLLAKLTFKLKATTDCTILNNAACGSNIAVNGSSTGIGNTTNVNLSNSNLIQGYTQNGSCVGEPIPAPLNVSINGASYVAQNCPNTDFTRHFTYCSTSTSVGTSEISSNFPVGSQFYNEFPITINSIQYTDANPIPLVAGSTITYYAVPAGGGNGCNFPFTISKCSAIVAQDDTIAGGNGTTGNPNAGNVLNNNGNGPDTLNGNPVTIAQVNMTVITQATPIGANPVPFLNTSTGQISIPPGTPAGTYTIVYQICDAANISNCDPATVTITVTAPVIDAVVDNINLTCATSGIIGNILSNDTLNGSQALISDVNLTILTGNYPNISINANGDVILAAGGTCGNYTFTYKICQKLNPNNCDNASVNISVNDNIAPTFTAPANIQIFTNADCSYNASIAVTGDVTNEADNCAAGLQATFIDTVANGPCQGSHIITRTWSLVDTCGNHAVDQVQIITVSDNIAPTFTAPANIEIFTTANCSYNASVAVTGDVTNEADNCSTVLQATFTDTVANGPCQGSHIITRTWSLVDACGNHAANQIQTIAVTDNIAPTFNAPANIQIFATADCSYNASVDVTGDVTNEADNCSTGLQATFIDTIASGTCEGSHIITRTWSLLDACGNQATNQVQTITVTDNIAPSWSTQATALNQTIECSDAASLTAAQALIPVATDNCDSDVTNIVKTSGQFVASTTCANSGTYKNTWTVTDDCGNTSAVFTQTITIQDTTAPTWSTAPNALNQTVECSDAAALASAQNLFPVATDNCDSDVTNIVKTSGQFVASQTCANAGTYTNTWTVTDACGNTSAIFTQTITVRDTTAPTWLTGATALNQTVECSDAAALASAQNLFPVATDNCDSDVSNIVKTSGQFVASQTCANAGAYTNTWTVADACGNTSSIFTQTITVQDTTAPVWSTQTGALDTTLECSDVQGLTNAQAAFPTATDNCDADVTNIVKTSGQFVASTTCVNAGTYTNTWTVTDACGNTSAVFTQTISVQDTTAPVWSTQTGALDVTLECSDIQGLAAALATFPIASDNCDADVANIVKTSGQFVASSTCANAGTYTNTWTVTDACGNTSAVFTQTITIQDTTKPQISTNASNLVVQCDGNGNNGALLQWLANNGGATATDNCSAVTWTNNFNAISNDCSAAVTVVFTASDACGNTETTSATFSIQDTLAPIWSTEASSLNATVECSDTQGLATAQTLSPIATDNCGTVTYVKTSGAFVASEGCPNAGTYTNTWTAVDACANNSATFTQTITVQDTIAPVWSTQTGALNVTLECSDVQGLAIAQAAFPIASDNCDADVTNVVKASGDFTPSSTCANAGTYTNTWTVTDACGNTSSLYTQTITLQDTTAPVWSTQTGALDITLECSNVQGLTAAQATFPTATDNCDADVTNVVKISGDFVASTTCANAGTYTNTWTVTDACGNTSAVFTQTITIQDTTAPVWSTQTGSLDVTVECSDAQGLIAAQALFPAATDACDSEVADLIKISGTFVASETCTNSGTYTNTWTVTDACGNTSAVFTQIITVQDSTAPTWITEAGSLNTTVECSDVQGLATAQTLLPIATDNCDSDVADIVKTSGAFIASEGCANAGTYTNTWTVTDSCGNSSSVFTQTITVQDTSAPTWVTELSSLDATIECSDVQGLATAQALFPTANDNCDSDVTNIVKTSGAFLASESCANAGTYTNKWTVTDACGNISAVFTQIITVQDNTAPVWSTEAGSLNATVECSDADALASAQALFPAATDNCDSDVANIIKTSGAFVASEACANTGTYTNTWNVTDACGNISAVFTQTITVQDTTAPTWTTIAGSLDATVECSDADALASAQALFPTATDNCSNVTYIKTSGNFVASQGCANSGTYTNSWTATDACGNPTGSSFVQTITVQDTTAPTWVTLGGSLDVAVECSDADALASAQALTPSATDNCSEVTYVKTAGNFVASETCANAGTYTNTWIATDACGNPSGTFTQTITVQDTTAPTWDTLAGSLDVAVECIDADALASAQALFPTATDNCSTVTYIKTSGDFVGSTGCANSGTYTNTWTATDACGNPAGVFTQVITVQDTTPPSWTTIADSLDVTVECSDAAGLASAQTLFPTATDNCSTVTYIKTSGAFVTGTCGGTYTNTWAASDACGNPAGVFTQTITVQDNSAPTWTTLIGSLDATVECSDAAALASAQALFPTATDNCSAVTYIKTSGVFVAADCPSNGTYTNTWIATDACGNPTGMFTQTITVQDTTAPILTTIIDLNPVVTCSTVPAVPASLDFTDNCSTVSTPIFTETESAVVNNQYTITRTWTVQDACGNTTPITQVITVNNVPDIINGLPVTQQICNNSQSQMWDLNNYLPAGTPTNGIWTNVSNVGALDGSVFHPYQVVEGNYTFSYAYDDGSPCPKVVDVIMPVVDCIIAGCDDILVHNAFTPNGDNLNEYFNIEAIDQPCYADNKVEIYNRWGVLVYETKNYDNNIHKFIGVSEGRSTVSKSDELPAGTYFYILEYTTTDGQTVNKDGYLYLTR